MVTRSLALALLFLRARACAGDVQAPDLIAVSVLPADDLARRNVHTIDQINDDVQRQQTYGVIDTALACGPLHWTANLFARDLFNQAFITGSSPSPSPCAMSEVMAHD